MEDQKFSLSVIIPALNEEKAISSTIRTVQGVVHQLGARYELILINDGSVDSTGLIMNNLARADQHKRIKVIHNQSPKNIGSAFRQGVYAARGEYVLLVAGDNETSRQALVNVIGKLGHSNLIISYPTNPEVRSRLRRVVSFGYVLLLNVLFGLKLRYFNGTFVVRRGSLMRLPPWTPGFGFTSEIVIQLIKSGITYEEIPVPLQPRFGGKSKALSFKNFLLVVKTLCALTWRVYFRRKASSDSV